MKELIKTIRTWAYKNLVWIFLIGSLLLLWLSEADLFSVKANEILQKFAFGIFSSGIFAAVLKSIQFTGLFKEEIEKIILGTDFIKNRNDLPILWKAVSKAIYQQKFPDISNNLEDLILSTYFPTNHKYYYEDAIISINIEEFDKDDNIKYTQTCKFTVVLAENVSEVTMSQEYTLDKGENISLSNSERIYYKIDGKDQMENMDVSETENDLKLIRTHSLVVSNKRSFTIEFKERRQYCIKNDNIKIFRVSSITKEMDVNISYPDNLMVTFFNVGVIKRFEPKHIDSKNSISRIHKNGLILPKQGFGMSFVSKL